MNWVTNFSYHIYIMNQKALTIIKAIAKGILCIIRWLSSQKKEKKDSGDV